MAFIEGEKRISKVLQLPVVELDFVEESAKRLSELEVGRFEITRLDLPGDTPGCMCFFI